MSAEYRYVFASKVFSLIGSFQKSFNTYALLY